MKFALKAEGQNLRMLRNLFTSTNAPLELQPLFFSSVDIIIVPIERAENICRWINEHKLYRFFLA
jgi:hypothetical protein